MRTRFAIWCGSRTGSTLLCELLQSTNRCGVPNEFLNPSLIPKFKEQLGLKLDCNWFDYKQSLFKKFGTKNSVFGIKLVGQMEQLNNFQEFGMIPTHWVWLYRRDRILQAISRYRAWKSNKWSKKIGDVTPKVDYSYSGIKWCLDEIEAEEIYFEDFFANRDHIKICYESDVCEEPDQTVVACLAHMGINIDEIPAVKSQSVVSRDEESYKWKDAFLKDGYFGAYCN